MAYYTAGPEEFASSQQGGLDTTPTTFGQALGATVAQGFEDMPTNRLAALGLHAAQSFGSSTPADELNRRYAIPGILSFDKPMNEDAARDLYEEKHAQALRADAIAHGPQSLGAHVGEFFAGQIPQFLDPINVGAAFVPGLGDARVAVALGRAADAAAGYGAEGIARGFAGAADSTSALGEALSGTGAGRVAQGASQGIAGQAALEPLDYLMDKDDHEDWSMGQAITDLAFGGLMGGGFHALGHSRNLSTDQHSAVLNEALSSASEGRDTVASEMANLFDPSNATNEGPFGPVFRGYEGDAQGAIAKLAEAKSGEAPGALYHPDIGNIDLVWGDQGTGKSDGYGLSKLMQYHPEVVNNLQDIVSGMQVGSRSDNRVQLESPDHKATVRLTYNSAKKNWLLTAYGKRTSKSATTDTALSDATDDTASRSTGAEDNIARQIDDFHQKARDRAEQSFTASAQGAVMSPPAADRAAARDTQAAAASAPKVETSDGSLEEAQKALDEINARLGIGTTHSSIPEAAQPELDRIDEARRNDEGYANALEAAGACLARNL